MSEELENELTEDQTDLPPVIHPTKSASCCADEDIPPIELTACDLWPAKSSSHDLLCTGRILKLTVHLNNVCANQLINMAVVICDATAGSTTFGNTLGYKVASFTTPTNTGTTNSCNTGLNVTGFCFAIPGDPCVAKKISVKVVAQYVPTTPTLPVACSTLV